MRLDATSTDFALRVAPVVGLVKTEILRTPRSSRRPNGNGVERGFHAPFVVSVRAGQGDGDRYAASVGENVALGAKLRAISRIGSCKAPPLGAFTVALSREAQAHSMPRSSS